MKFSFKKIVPILTGAIMLGSTVGFAAGVAGAATYPSSFADAVVVIGAASADSAAANDIAADLGKLTVTEATTVSEGWLAQKAGEDLNYGDDIYDIDTKIDEGDLPDLLADGIYKETKGTNDNDVDYEQYISFTNSGNQIKFEANKEVDDEPTDTFLKMPKGTAAYEYDLKFVDSPKYDNSTSALLKSDFELSKINILGSEWTFTDASGTGNHPTKLTLMGGATASTLKSGGSVDLVMDGKTYSISVTVYTDEAQFVVNGESLTIDEGDTDELSDGTQIGVTEISTSTKEAVADMVEFYLGARKLILENTKEVNLNGEDVDGSYVTITVDTANTELDEIKVKFTPEDDTYVAVGEEWTEPVFDKFKFVLASLTQDTEEITVTTSASDGELEVEDTGGNAIEIPFITDETNVWPGDDEIDTNYIASVIQAGAAGGGNLLVADNDVCVSAVANLTGCEDGLMFLAVTSGGEARIIEVKDIDMTDEEIDFKDLTTDKDISGVDFNSTVGASNAAIDLGFMTIDFTVLNSTGGTDGAPMMLNFTDINQYDNEVDQAFETSLGGALKVELAGVASKVLLYQENNSEIANFNITVDSDGDMIIDNLSPTMTDVEKDSDIQAGLDGTNWGAIFTWDSEDKDDLTIDYPEEKTIANVYVSPVEAIVAGGGVVPVVKDTEIGTLKTTKDLVVVGGPAINRIAAELLELSFPTYGADAGWSADEAYIRLFEGELTPDKVALLVAGYESKDTLAAAKALIAEKKFGTLKTTTASTYSYEE